jgi:hypothetical protein
MSLPTSFGGYDDGESYDSEQLPHFHHCHSNLTNGDATEHSRSAIVCECANKDNPTAIMESENTPQDPQLNRRNRRPLSMREQQH